MTTIIVLLISAFVIVNGASFDGREEYLKEVTKNVLNETESLKSNIELTLLDIKRTNASISELIQKMPSIVSKHKVILDIQKTVNNTKVNKKRKAKCQKIFEKKVKELSSDIQKRMTKVFKKQFEDAEKKLSYMKEDLLAIEDSIRNNLDKEIRDCEQYGYQCMITKASIPNKDKYIKFVDEVKTVVNGLTEFITNLLDIQIVPARNEKIVLEPVIKCLTKISCK